VDKTHEYVVALMEMFTEAQCLGELIETFEKLVDPEDPSSGSSSSTAAASSSSATTSSAPPSSSSEKDTESGRDNLIEKDIPLERSTTTTTTTSTLSGSSATTTATQPAATAAATATTTTATPAPLINDKDKSKNEQARQIVLWVLLRTVQFMRNVVCVFVLADLEILLLRYQNCLTTSFVQLFP